MGIDLSQSQSTVNDENGNKPQNYAIRNEPQRHTVDAYNFKNLVNQDDNDYEREEEGKF